MAPSTEETPTRWDWWPLARLLTVLAVFGILAHARLGWTLDFKPLREFPRQVFEVFSLFTLLSFGLAHLYLILLMLPLYALVTLNDTFYNATIWAGRTMFRLRPGRGLSLVGMAGELVAFSAALVLAERLLG